VSIHDDGFIASEDRSGFSVELFEREVYGAWDMAAVELSLRKHINYLGTRRDHLQERPSVDAGDHGVA
jgi:hypothetical protein